MGSKRMIVQDFPQINLGMRAKIHFLLQEINLAFIKMPLLNKMALYMDQL